MVKPNQPGLHAQLAGLPWRQIPAADIRHDRGHGRAERRSLKVTAVAAGIAFPHAAQAIQVGRRRRPLNGKNSKKWSAETVYAVTSLTAARASPAQLAAILRGHWLIEDSLHWVRDMTFGEDSSPGPHPQRPARHGQLAQPGHHHLAPDRARQHRRSPALPRTATRKAATNDHAQRITTLPTPWGLTGRGRRWRDSRRSAPKQLHPFGDPMVHARAGSLVASDRSGSDRAGSGLRLSAVAAMVARAADLLPGAVQGLRRRDRAGLKRAEFRSRVPLCSGLALSYRDLTAAQRRLSAAGPTPRPGSVATRLRHLPPASFPRLAVLYDAGQLPGDLAQAGSHSLAKTSLRFPDKTARLPGKGRQSLKSACRPMTRRVCEGSGVGSERPAPEFAKLLRQLRTSAGLTQEELADSATVSPRTVSDLERGISLTARAPTARLLATALNLAGSARSEFLAAAQGRLEADNAAVPGGGATHRRESEHRTLPRDISVFTGRAEEFERTVRAVMHAGAGGGVIGICAIGGMAGIGKTTLAVHAAHALARCFPDGQIFVPLHGHTPGHRPVDPAEALAGLLLAAGFDARRIPAEQDARERCWRDYLAGRKVLLVLDDAASYDHVRPLLPGTGESTALITSRQRLTALDDATVISLDSMSRLDAATLLVRLSGRPGLRIDDPAVTELARLGGDLPLAIGMLARQLHHHPAWIPAGLAAELAAARDRLDLMRTENVSVAATFDLSYRNLTAGQRRLFRRLGLHPGADIDRYAAAALADVSVTVASRQLGALYDQHLISEPAAGRYRLHDLLRERARTLAAADRTQDGEAAIGRLLDYYAHTAVAAARHIPTWTTATKPPAAPGRPPAHQPPVTSHDTAARWMEAERANLYAVASHAADTTKPAYVIALSAAMAGFLEARGPWDKAIAQQEAAIAAAVQAGDKAGQAGALNQLSGMQAMTGDAKVAAANGERAMELYRELGDLGGLADTMCGDATLFTSLGDYQHATDLAREALRLYTRIGHRRGQADAVNALGALQSAAGDYRAALASHRQALQVLTDLGDRWGQMRAEIDLGILLRLTGDHAKAELTQRQALRTCRNYQDRYAEAFIINELGVLRRLAGDYDTAAASLGQALDLYRDIGHHDGIAMASNDLGLLWQLTGDYEAASASHLEALAICTDCGLLPLRTWVLNSLGELCNRTGNSGQARDYHTQALRIARDLPEPREEGRALEGIGRSYVKDNQPGKAQPMLTQAFEIYEQIGILKARGVREMLSDATARRH